MQSTQISISDHFLLHVFVKLSNLYQRGPSYWKLNDKVLKNKASSIRKDLRNFVENESPSSYENFKHNFYHLLKFIQENQMRVDQIELKSFKYHQNVLRDCIHSGKGPNPSLVEKISYTDAIINLIRSEVAHNFPFRPAMRSNKEDNYKADGHRVKIDEWVTSNLKLGSIDDAIMALVAPELKT